MVEVRWLMYGTVPYCSPFEKTQYRFGVLLLKMVDKSTSSLQTHFGPVFGDEAVQIGHLTLK
jgi:hypothetical protein